MYAVSEVASLQVLPPALLLRAPPRRGLRQRQCQAMLRALARQILASALSTPGRGLLTLAWRQHKHFKHRYVTSLPFSSQYVRCSVATPDDSIPGLFKQYSGHSVYVRVLSMGSACCRLRPPRRRKQRRRKPLRHQCLLRHGALTLVLWARSRRLWGSA